MHFIIRLRPSECNLRVVSEVKIYRQFKSTSHHNVLSLLRYALPVENDRIDYLYSCANGDV